MNAQNQTGQFYTVQDPSNMNKSEIDKKQELLKFVQLKGYNDNLSYKNIPIQWITPKKKSTGSKSNTTTKKLLPKRNNPAGSHLTFVPTLR